MGFFFPLNLGICFGIWIFNYKHLFVCWNTWKFIFIHSVTVVITILVLHAGQSWILELAKLLKQIAFSTGSITTEKRTRMKKSHKRDLLESLYSSEYMVCYTYLFLCLCLLSVHIHVILWDIMIRVFKYSLTISEFVFKDLNLASVKEC